MRTLRTLLSFVLAAGCALGFATPAIAQKDSALGTLTVKDKTAVLRHVTVVRYAAPGDPSDHTLVIVASDRPLAAADLRGTTLLDRTAAGQLRAVRVEWREGYDSVVTIPYHPDLADSGEPTRGGAVINLQAYDEKRLEVTLKSKMLGQDWQFDVRAAAAVIDGGVLEPRAERAKVVEPAPPRTAISDATARKRALGRLGYEFTPEDFYRAIQDGGIAAVDLFIELGMKGTVTGSDGTPGIVAAAMSCAYEPKAPRPQVIASLLRAGANPNSKDSNNATPLIWAAEACPLEAIQMLIKAGADVNARARGGATALTSADVFKRRDIVAALKAAGAK